MYHYNYVIFNSSDNNKLRRNPDGYYTICLQELESCESIRIVSQPLDYTPHLLRIIYSMHNSAKIAKKVRLPLKSCWYPFYFRNDFKDDKPLCFIILSRSLPFSYLEYLKNHYRGSKLVLMHRDLLKVCERCAPGLVNNPLFDLEMTFDQGESKQYGFPHFNEFESKIDITIKDTPECDVFFAGKGKDRLPLLLAAYDHITQAGLTCHYYLTGVPQCNRIQFPGITYADHFMTYREMLYHTVNSRCILEINQGGADGYTSRFLEAVMYNKRLLTNNFFIKNSPFYNSGYIQCFENASEIDPEFIRASGLVDYHYNGEFSPYRMVERVDEELVKRYGG